MGHCGVCGVEITELSSNRCVGFACQKRLCFQCYSNDSGYCPRCKILREADVERCRFGGSLTQEQLILDQLEDLEEPEKKDAEKVFKEDRILRRIRSSDDSTESYILKRLEEINKELEKPEEEQEEDE